MAEVQKNTESGETAQRFIEFVMMQAQSAMFYLGQIPHPQTGAPVEANLDVAKMCIDQLAMIREKTRGNLSMDETGILNNAIGSLQMAFVEISQKQGGAQTSIPATAQEPDPTPPAAAAEPAPADEQTASAEESKKKFTKSYGS